MKRLLLAGGGHSHIEVLRRFAIERPAETDITLVTPSPFLLYTGMWPGWVAGIYETEECMINVERLAEAAGCHWVQSNIVGIDPLTRTVHLEDGSWQDYDCLAIDIGATPPWAGVTGANTNAVPVKPVKDFADWWRGVLAEGKTPIRIGIAGAGVGGVETAMAIEHRLRQTAAGSPFGEVFIAASGDDILPGQNALVRRWINRILAGRGIEVHAQAKISEVEKSGLLFADGRRLAFDHLVWVTGAAAAPWLKYSGLATDERGFISVNAALQSVSHREVFASGDVATQTGEPRPKSGVFPVRQGPILAENLRRALNGQHLADYHPQRHALALIGTGERYAIASRGLLALRGAWVWGWKEKIDRQFVARYR